MVGPIEGRHFDVHHRITGDDTRINRFLDAFVDGRNELARNRSAHDAIHELITLARIRFELEPHVAILTAATGLAHKLAFRLNLATNGLAVGHLRLTNVCLDFELATHTVDDDFEV